MLPVKNGVYRKFCTVVIFTECSVVCFWLISSLNLYITAVSAIGYHVHEKCVLSFVLLTVVITWVWSPDMLLIGVCSDIADPASSVISATRSRPQSPSRAGRLPVSGTRRWPVCRPRWTLPTVRPAPSTTCPGATPASPETRASPDPWPLYCLNRSPDPAPSSEARGWRGLMLEVCGLCHSRCFCRS